MRLPVALVLLCLPLTASAARPARAPESKSHAMGRHTVAGLVQGAGLRVAEQYPLAGLGVVAAGTAIDVAMRPPTWAGVRQVARHPWAAARRAATDPLMLLRASSTLYGHGAATAIEPNATDMIVGGTQVTVGAIGHIVATDRLDGRARPRADR